MRDVPSLSRTILSKGALVWEVCVVPLIFVEIKSATKYPPEIAFEYRPRDLSNLMQLSCQSCEKAK